MVVGCHVRWHRRPDRRGSFQGVSYGYAASAIYAQRQLPKLHFVSFFSAHPYEK